MSELSVRFAGIPFKNPVTVASGTFAFGREYVDFFDLSRLGGIAVKGLTYTERQGNRPPRIAETPMGMLNSIGLQNPGYRAFIETELPWLRRFDTVLIANITGATPREYAEMAEALGGAGLDLIEINVSCPNVKEGGALFGASAGGITEGLSVGQPVLISDQLNLTGRSPLDGAHFVNMVDAYSPRLRERARSVDPSLVEGVYAGLPGPQYETPAEIRMLGRLGADLVGMSTVHETIAARAENLEVLGLSLVTNLAAGITGEPLNHSEVLEVGAASASRMGELLAELIGALDAG